MLIEPNEQYNKHIETSKHYLNCPKFMLNYNLFSLMHTHSADKLNTLIWFLKLYGFSSPTKKAESFIESFDKMSWKEFEAVNQNTYLNKTLAELPARARETDSRLNHEWEMSKRVWGYWDWAVGIPFDKQCHRYA